MKYAILLAAGESTRMKTNKNKVMHQILHKPMIGHLVDNLAKVGFDETVVVTGYKNEEVEQYLEGKVSFAFQEERKGTADAVSKVTQLQNKKGSTLLVLGDCALIQPETIESMFKAHEGHALTLVSSVVKEPGNLRRIIRDNQGAIERVAPASSLNEDQKSIDEIALGAYVVDNELLFKYIQHIIDDAETNNEEFNISKMVKVFRENGHAIKNVKVNDYVEFTGANDRHQLLESEKWLQDRINTKHMDNGVTLLSPKDIYIGPDVSIEQDVIIYPNNHIYGQSTIQSETKILPNNWLNNAIIGKKVELDSSKIVDSEVGCETTVGPNAHLRADSKVGKGCRIGNFVEFKTVTLGDSTSCAHLVYLGNTNVGKNVNIGCGVVTANYDGLNKNTTNIGDNSFIGSNANLIAPINIGSNVLVAAGSTITDDVPDGDMAIARNRTEVKVGYGNKFINKEVK